jgi:Ser/Thr protein kinase RdoA (MazF antagonist)
MVYAANSKANTPIAAKDREEVEASDESEEVKQIILQLLAGGEELKKIQGAKPDPNEPLNAEDQAELNRNIQELEDLNGGDKAVDLPVASLNGKKYSTFQEAAAEH